MNNVEVSVIIPIYNVEKYLNDCLLSIVNQTFKHYEVILVNDGSSDKSYEIAKKYSEEYGFINLINKENQGLGAARNTGLEQANGKYILFVDSDDYISSEYISKLYNAAEKSNSDIVICGHEKIYEDNKSNSLQMLDLDCSKLYSNIEVLKFIFKRKIRCYAWDKIYKKELFDKHNIKYLEGRLYEDILTTIKLISISDKICFVNDSLYNYRIRKGNITSIKNEKSIVDLNYSINEVNKYIKNLKLDDKLKNELINFNTSYILGSLDMLSIYTSYNCKLFYKEYNNYYKDTRFDNYNIKDVITNRNIAGWIKRDFLLFKMKLLPLKNKFKNYKF